MPRSIQQILDHADEMAQRFESYEPAAGDERSIEEYLLQRAALARRAASARCWTRWLPHGLRVSPGGRSASCSVPRLRPPSSGTARSSRGSRTG